MEEWLSINNLMLRFYAFATVFLLLCVLEIKHPKRQLTQPKFGRWINNISLVILNNILIKFLIPFLAIDAAQYTSMHNWGINAVIHNSSLLLTLSFTVLSIAFLDFAIYWQHRLFHRIPMLWRIHRMHHSDMDLDVTSAIRFHPIEIIISLGIKISLILLLGLPPLAVIVFEILLNLTAMFNHSNIAIPTQFDRLLRKVLVTPDMHRVHHSIIRNECDKNYGFCLPLWDHLFKSYQDKPIAGHIQMEIGLPYFRNENEYQLQHMLTQPFRADIYNRK